MTDTNKVTLVLTLDQTNMVLEGLGALPLVRALDTFVAIRKQAEPQVAEQPNGVAVREESISSLAD